MSYIKNSNKNVGWHHNRAQYEPQTTSATDWGTQGKDRKIGNKDGMRGSTSLLSCVTQD